MPTEISNTGLEARYQGALGTYSLAMPTGAIGAGLAAGSEIFQFRWTSSTSKAIIQLITLSAGNTSTAFTAGVVQIDAAIARAWTAAGTGGGTATITGDNANLRTGMPATGVGEIRIATTAALGAGTKTLDAQAFAGVGHSVPNVAGTPVIPAGTVLWDAATGEGHPIDLRTNEGFVIRATVPATGTWTAYIGVKWVEMAV